MNTQQQAAGTNHDLGFSIDPDIMFSNHKGQYKKRTEKRQISLARKLPNLERFLGQDEKVLLITTGCSPIGFLEWFVTGWIVFYLKRSLFVFTNKRIFHIPTTRTFQYRNSIAEIRYADCQELKLRRGNLAVKYKSGRKDTFPYLARAERARIKNLVSNYSPEGEQSESRDHNHLCPRCTGMLIKENYTCPSCRLQFKSMSEARKISIIFPGGGYFYTGHPFLGLGDAIVEVFLILIVASSLVDVIGGVPDSEGALIVFGLALAFEKIISVYHSNHFIEEYIPKDRKITPVNSL